MKSRMKWGVAILILLLGAAVVFIIQHEIAENRELKEQLAESQKLADEIKAQEALKNNPPVAREGYKMVPHGDHWHEVPIDAPDTWQGEPHEPKSQEPLSDMSKFKIDLPDEIPEDFPTEAELREMDLDLLIHLVKLYTKESDKLKETDRETAARLYNATVPIVRKIMGEKLRKSNAIMEAHEKEHRKEFPVPRYIPATEDSSAVFIDVIPPEKVSAEGGKQ